MTSSPALPRVAHGDFTRDLDLTQEEFLALLDLASAVKASPGDFRAHLAGRSVALLFEKPSLRTRMTFELAIQQLGGFAILNDGVQPLDAASDVFKMLADGKTRLGGSR